MPRVPVGLLRSVLPVLAAMSAVAAGVGTSACGGRTGLTSNEKTGSGGEAPRDQRARFAVLSDLHFYDAALGTRGDAFRAHVQQHGTMLAESGPLLDAVTERVLAAHPDFVLVPGDLTNDGELVNHQRVANRLADLEDAGVEVFVVPGDADVDNPRAVAYEDSGPVPVEGTTEADFARVHDRYGYGQAIDRDDESLSYLAEPVSGLWLLAFDTSRHRENTPETGPLRGGHLGAGTRRWALDKLRQAEQQHKRVVGMMHHGLLEHFRGQAKAFPEYGVDHAADIVKELANAGLDVVFTGHNHANDIVRVEVDGGSAMTEVETGSLVTHPSPFRVVDFASEQDEMVITTESTRTLPGQPNLGSAAAARRFDAYREQVTTALAGGSEMAPEIAEAVAPLVAQALTMHGSGDEPFANKATLDAAAALEGAGSRVGELWGSLLRSLHDDLPPSDNNLVLRLREESHLAHFFAEPYLLSLSPADRMSVVWLTAEPAEDSHVLYGRRSDSRQSVRAKTYPIVGLMTVDDEGAYTVPLAVYQHVAELERLDPNTSYSYQAVSRDQRSSNYDFTTAPRSGEQSQFVLLSDLQLAPGTPTVVRMAGARGADFVIYNGDLLDSVKKAGEWFPVLGGPEEYETRWFPTMQQRDDGARLLQHIPIYPTPGNHDFDDASVFRDPATSSRNKISLGIYMQMFRPLYPEQQSGVDGKHWYSATYGDLHLVSLSVSRWFSWDATEPPGWYMVDGIGRGSPQYEWLEDDLIRNREKYTWITQHWHMLNRTPDLAVPFTDPVPSAGDPSVMTYDASKDYMVRDLMPLFEANHVNGVSFGHSHVYERYAINGVHYIEAASMRNHTRSEDDPLTSPNIGLAPAFEENRFRAFLIVSTGRDGLVGTGIQASVEADGIGNVGRVFDRFKMAD